MPALEATNMVGGLSSAGRAPALQAGGHRFDPDRLHQASALAMFRYRADNSYSRDEDTNFAGLPAIMAGFARFFDIVNGFF